VVVELLVVPAISGRMTRKLFCTSATPETASTMLYARRLAVRLSTEPVGGREPALPNLQLLER
ncbi:MAG TPA: hypothetical protein VJ180_06510, partial [Pyrinomonadaceae bacterium]|nr:hypothetical protein [Pyrinomonadaceae bacterium]